MNQGNSETKMKILSSCINAGPTWKKMSWAVMQDLDKAQSKIAFYGKNSKVMFERRLAAMKALMSKGECYLQGADYAYRVELAEMLAKSQANLGKEIKNSPMPQGLEAEAMEMIKKSLEQMAEPFEKKGAEFAQLAQEQKAKIAPQSTVAMKTEMPSQVKDVALTSLKVNPQNMGALESLKAFYESKGQMRLAAYWSGRISQLKSGGM
jgi:hypothetical protein